MDLSYSLTLVASLKQEFGRRIVLGDAAQHNALVLYRLYSQLKDFAEAKKDAGEEGYESAIAFLDVKLLTIKNCPQICYQDVVGEYNSDFEINFEFD